MVYTSLFIGDLNDVVSQSSGAITLAQVTDRMVKSAENRIIRELRMGGNPTVGVSVTYQDLFNCSYSDFQPLLEDAAIFGTLSQLNNTGKGNSTVGPITAAAGDGMSKSHGYISGKTPNPNALATAEEQYLKIMSDIFQTYRMLCGGKRENWARHNEVYDQDWNVNNMDLRKSEGNPR